VIISRRIRWLGHVLRIGKRRSAYSGLVGKPEVKRSLARRKYRWEDNIQMNLHEMGWGGA
jgi:hypothetical protein